MDYYNSLPDLVKINLPIGDCKAVDNKVPKLPNPGEFVLAEPGLEYAALEGPKCPTPAGNQSVAAGTNVKNFAAFTPPAKDSNQVIPVSGGSSGSGALPSAPATSGGNDGLYTQPAATSTAAASSGGNDGQYTQPAATSAQSSDVATSSAAANSAAPAVGGSASFQTMTIPASSDTASAYPTMSPSDGLGISGPSTGAAAPTGSASSSGGNDSTPAQCSNDGELICISETSFAICDHGKAVAQQCAEGTRCKSGAIVKKRSVIIPRHPHGGHRAHFRYE